jgi:uncharacterized protein (DUF1015 family)
MPRVAPFIALRYDPAVVGPLDRVTAPPYDVISASRRRSLLEGNPFSIVHLDLAEGSEDPGDPESRYARAAELLETWEAQGALVRTPEPVYYAYEMAFDHVGVQRAIRGVLVGLELEPWGAGVIPHERTMPGPLQDRLRLLRATQTHLSPVYGTIAGPCSPLAEILHAASQTPPAEQTSDDQGVRHRLWPLPAELDVTGWLSDEPLLIADGHHRYTTALRYRVERGAAQGSGPWDRVLALVVDAAAEHLPVLPFHRLQLAGPIRPAGDQVPDLESLLAAISDDQPSVGLTTLGDSGPEFRVVRLRGAAPAVRALHEEILDVRAPEGALRFVHDASSACTSVEEGEALAAWLLPPTTTERIREVIDRGERLPQKSTYFWPKPRTGMVMMPVDDPAAG